MNKDLEPYLRLQEIIAKLRSPGGCPWDREQTPATLRAYLLEEVSELIEAIDDDDPEHIKEELGDLLLLINMICEMYSENGKFNSTDVIKAINNKIIRRHPHVFDNVQANNSQDVTMIWNQVKTEVEGRTEDSKTIRSSIASNLPALLISNKIQKKVAKQGFDWQNKIGPEKKIQEKLAEISDAANGSGNLEEEVGDLLFSIVNYSRHLKINPELALRKANMKFVHQFEKLEDIMKKEKKEMNASNLALMESFWEKLKS